MLFKRSPKTNLLCIILVELLIYFLLYTAVSDHSTDKFVNFKEFWKENVTFIQHNVILLPEVPNSQNFKNLSSISTNESMLFSKLQAIASVGARKVSKLDLMRILNNKIIRYEIEPLLTLFTSWNDDSRRHLVRNHTVKNWASLLPFVIPVVFTDEKRIASECRRKGWNVLPVRVAAADGIPVLKHMFEDVMAAYNTTFYAYSNSDILYTDTLIDTLASYAFRLYDSLDIASSTSTVQLVKSSDIQKPVLIIGRRVNVENVTETESSTWKNITSTARRRGELFSQWAMDYFITTKFYPWKDIAEVVVGVLYYDDYLVYNARKQNHTVIDATKTLLALHQTTSAGNYESRAHKHSLYDYKLLRKMDPHVNYHAGTADCAQYYTQYQDGCIVVTNRFLSWECNMTQVFMTTTEGN